MFFLPLIFAFSSLALAIAYLLLIQQILKSWHQTPEIQLPLTFIPTTFISVVIAARNEEAGIAACLDSLLACNYPTPFFEIIVIDDHSEDATFDIVKQYRDAGVRVFSLAEHLKGSEEGSAFKKMAVRLGIQKAKGSLIATTDADCKVPVNWLHYLAYCHEYYKAEIVAGPVLLHKERNALERFQSLDFAGMMVFTGAALQSRLWPMANGANLAYSKAFFKSVGGFEGGMGFASGDDVLLLQKAMQSRPESILFLKQKEAVVVTTAKQNWRSFFWQRLRWGTKNSRIPSLASGLVLGTVFIFSVFILGTFLAIPVSPAFILPLFLFVFACKAFGDYLLLRTATDFFNRPELLKKYLLSAVYHLLYIAIVGLSALFIREYKWKGRRSK